MLGIYILIIMFIILLISCCGNTSDFKILFLGFVAGISYAMLSFTNMYWSVYSLMLSFWIVGQIKKQIFT